MIPGGGKVRMENVVAACPEAVHNAPTPPSSMAIFCSTRPRWDCRDGIEEPGFLKVEQLADLLGGLVFDVVL